MRRRAQPLPSMPCVRTCPRTGGLGVLTAFTFRSWSQAIRCGRPHSQTALGLVPKSVGLVGCVDARGRPGGGQLSLGR